MSQVRDQNKEADRSRQGRSEQGRPIGPLLADQEGLLSEREGRRQVTVGRQACSGRRDRLQAPVREGGGRQTRAAAGGEVVCVRDVSRTKVPVFE